MNTQPIETIKVEGKANCLGFIQPHEDTCHRMTEFNEHGIAQFQYFGFGGGWTGSMSRERWEELKAKEIK